MRLAIHASERIDEMPLDWHAASDTVRSHVQFVPGWLLRA
jgi:hypothetical protein